MHTYRVQTDPRTFAVRARDAEQARRVAHDFGVTPLAVREMGVQEADNYCVLPDATKRWNLPEGDSVHRVVQTAKRLGADRPRVLVQLTDRK